MMRDDVKIWIAIEYAREDEAGHRCRGLIRPTKRPPDLILRSVFGLVISEPLTPCRVHPDWFATLIHVLEECFKVRMIYGLTLDIGIYLHASGAQLLNRSF